MPLITQYKRKPGAVKQELVRTQACITCWVFADFGILPQWGRRRKICKGEDGVRGAFVRVRESTVGGGSQPCPLGLAVPEARSKGCFCLIVQAWRSKALELPWPSRLLPLPGAHQPCFTGPRSSGSCPWGTRLGSKKSLLLESPC